MSLIHISIIVFCFDMLYFMLYLCYVILKNIVLIAVCETYIFDISCKITVIQYEYFLNCCILVSFKSWHRAT
jgi:hypothetical protein